MLLIVSGCARPILLTIVSGAVMAVSACGGTSTGPPKCSDAPIGPFNGAAPDTRPTVAAATRPTTRAARAADLAYDRRISLTYVEGTSGMYAPAYGDTQTKAIYRWRGVEMRAQDCPFGADDGLGGGVLFTHGPIGNGWKVIAIDPPLRYLKLAGGKVAPGYWDGRTRVFYRFKGVEYDLRRMSRELLDRDVPRDLPPTMTDVGGRRSAKDDSPRLVDPDWVGKTVEIDVPPA
jgi:hypothetical protein